MILQVDNGLPVETGQEKAIPTRDDYHSTYISSEFDNYVCINISKIFACINRKLILLN